MKIFKLVPIRIKANTYSGATGLVDVVYEKRFGLLWKKRKAITRRAMSTSGILWFWQDSPNHSLFDVTKIIDGNVPELVNSETIVVALNTCDC